MRPFSNIRRCLSISVQDPLAEDTLQLGVEITCASPPHSRVVCCSSCQGREVCLLSYLLSPSRIEFL